MRPERPRRACARTRWWVCDRHMTAPPVAVRRELDELRGVVGAQIPAKAPDNLLIGTWNLRAFGNVSGTWAVGPGQSPRRDWRAVASIAAVVGAFDVVALQEVKRSTAALRFLVELLGPTWKVVASDVTEGDAGNDERLAFLYDSSRVEPSGLVGEIVLPPSARGAANQFARTPYAMGFDRDGVELVLTTVHVLWGNPATRLPEITAFAEWMRAWAGRKDDWSSNLIVLGDFNLDRVGNPLYEAFIGTGLWPPAELNALPRTIFDDDKDRHFYDQLAWFSTPDGKTKLEHLNYTHHAGSFDFVPHMYPGLTKTELSWRVSDHYPLWAEFAVD